MRTEEIRKVVADMNEWLCAAHPKAAHPYACATIPEGGAWLHAYLGKGHWSEPVTDDRFADAAFRLRTRIAAEYRPEEGEAA